MSVARVSGVRVMYQDRLPVSLVFQQPRHSLAATAKAQACIFMRAMPFEGGAPHCLTIVFVAKASHVAKLRAGAGGYYASIQ